MRRLGRVQAHDVGLELFDHAGQRHDVEHALTTGQEVDDLAVGASQDRAGAGQDQVGRREVGAEVLAQALDGAAGRLQRDAGVEQLLDHLELEHVGIRIDPTGATALGGGDRRLQQAGTGPVVELSVGDPHQAADLRPVKPSDTG